MYINAVLSSLGAWSLFKKKHSRAYDELEQAIRNIKYKNLRSSHKITSGDLHTRLNRELEQEGWDIGIQITLRSGKSTIFTIDFLKDQVGGKLILAKRAFILSSLLANFPLSAQIHNIEVPVILLPMTSLKKYLQQGVADFELVRKFLEELPPSAVRYPFVIIGFANRRSKLKVVELTSKIDHFLLDTVGYTLNEMILLGEKPCYDFKVQPPKRADTLTKEICGMANLKGGGIVVIGISDDGELKGVANTEVDDMKLRMTNSIRTLCKPIPSFEFLTFDLNDKPKHCLLVCHVHETKRKPCLVRSKVYIRSGPSAQTADSEEIRKMVLSL